eukprot:6175312-Pleurochrysis_carterae.AAC.7
MGKRVAAVSGSTRKWAFLEREDQLALPSFEFGRRQVDPNEQQFIPIQRVEVWHFNSFASRFRGIGDGGRRAEQAAQQIHI